MNEIITELYKLRKGVQYRDSDHTYWRDDQQLISSTQLKSRYKEDFDAIYWSLYKSLEALPGTNRLYKTKGGYMLNEKFVSVKQATEMVGDEAAALREQWEDHRKKSLDRGTHIHTLFEKAWMCEVTENELINDFCFSKMDEGWIPLMMEVLVANDVCAGRFDGLFLDPEGRKTLGDIKTDAAIKFMNPYQKMRSPFDDLTDCNFNGYTVQLNIYKDIIEQGSNLTIDRLVIFHYRDDVIELIEVPFYSIPWQQLNLK